MNKNQLVIRVHGAFEVNNFGDILLVKIFVEWVRQLGHIPQILNAPNYVQKECNTQLECDTRPDAIIFVGGGYLGEPKRSYFGRWKWGNSLISRHLSVMKEAADAEIPYGIIGTGFGPISNLVARYKARSLINQSSITVLRDRESFDFATSYGCKVDFTSADAALSVHHLTLNTEAQSTADMLMKHANGKPILLVQLDQSEDYGPEWMLLSNSLLKCIDPNEFFVVGVSDQSGTSVSLRHKKAADGFLKNFDHSLFLPYQNIDSFIGTISAANMVITNKLHIGIVSTALNKPVVSLPTHQKTLRFYKQLDREYACVPKALWSEDSICDAYRKVHSNIKEVSVVPREVLSLSEANFNYLKRFIESIEERNNLK